MATVTMEPKAVSQLINVEEAAKMCGGISVWTMRRHAYRGDLASVKLGGHNGRLMFEVSELERFIAENTRPRFTPRPVRESAKRVAS
jgi:Helix-turn-helix domain